MRKLNIENIYVEHPDGNNCGYAQELRWRLGDMLEMAERLFGQRDCSFTILGIKFRDDGPSIEYWRRYEDRKIYIILHTSATGDIARACFQMAHETVHLLAPVRIEDANNLEEGVACCFSLYYMEKKGIEPKLYYGMKSYKHVLKLVTPRLKEDMYCVQRLRKRQSSFQDISQEELHKEFADLAEEDVCFLTSKFIRGED